VYATDATSPDEDIMIKLYYAADTCALASHIATSSCPAPDQVRAGSCAGHPDSDA